jgi:hypothetical protein
MSTKTKPINVVHEYPFPTDYTDRWEKETIAVRDCFWKASMQERRKFSKLNPCIFGEQYIKPYIRRWNTHTAKHQYYMMYEGLKHESIVIHIPVEHAKSTWFSLVLPLWFLINDRNTHGAILSNTSTQACSFLSAIKWNIENNDRLKNDFPELLPDYDRKWTEKEIMVVRDKEMQSKDPSIIARGTGNAILGTRLEWVIADDVCDLDNTANEIQRQKTLSWWNEIVDSRVVENGRKIVIGTLQHNNDLLCTLSSNKYYKYICLKALSDNKIPLWDKYWSLSRLMKKKDTIGSLAFAKVMQNDRMTSSNKSLKPEWLQFYGVGEKYNFNISDDDVDIYIAIDPAIADDKTTAEKRRLDKFALVVVGLDKVTKHMFLWDYDTNYYTFPEQIKVIDKYYKKYSNINTVKKVGIEQAAFQKALKQQAFLLKSMPPVIGINTGTSSKATKIESFGVYCETKRFFVQKTHNEFIDEFIEFEPGGKSPNILDACTVIVAMVKGVATISDIRIYQKKKFNYNW